MATGTIRPAAGARSARAIRSIQRKMLLPVLLLVSSPSLSFGKCDSPVAVVSSLEGGVEVRSGNDTWRQASIDEPLCAGDSLRVGPDGRGALTLADHTLVRLGAATTVTLEGPQEDKGFLVELIEGITHFMSRVPRSLDVKTPFVNAGVEGTEFQVRVEEERTRVAVLEGRVAVENAAGRLLLVDGQSAVAGAGTAPVLQTGVRPWDAVRWTLYYPALFDGGEYAGRAAADSPLGKAVALQSEGKTAEALALLGQIGEPDADTLTYRASLRLAVGQPEAAQADLERSLRMRPDDGNALALTSIVAVVQGRKARALEAAEAAVKAEPRRPAPYLALSYALQADFRLEQARLALEEAAAANPDSALVWARLAELHLMFRNIDQAVEASGRATALEPGNAHAHMVRGFARLVAMDTGAAAEAFNQAIEQDPSMPLPRLGLGLALIRDGRLQEGRRAIEIAAILDPGNALVRSYLGKAYYEERRDEPAREQYALAMQADPLDPTPSFYNAILLQADNRPVEALEALDDAIEKNDNRAIYRSRLLLDDDLATRGASVAGIYNTLGFDELARIEASHSIGRNPANSSAHRLLSDSYSNLSRHQIARASELLKSQLLQPLNHNPVQPQTAENDLFVVERAGAADAAYHEYHPLFARDGTTFLTSIMGGSHGTVSDEVIVSGIHDNASYSLGRYHYKSDGFRENNDLEHEIYNAFGQVAISPKLSLQAEFRQRETEGGDLSMSFDPDDFIPGLRSEYDRQSARLGLHYRPRPNHHFLVSVIRQEADDFRQITTIDDDLSEFSYYFDPTDTSYVTRDERRKSLDTGEYELQYLHTGEWLSGTWGAGMVDQALESDWRLVQTLVVPDDRPIRPEVPFEPNVDYVADSSVKDLDARYRNAYGYLDIRAGKNAVWTLGASYDEIEYVGTEYHVNDSNRVNPKLGLTWQFMPDTRLRAAWFKTTKRPFASNQTIEPTQVAGFNQFFDETTGALTERHGVALDHQAGPSVYLGLSASQRESEQPRFTETRTLAPNVLEEESAGAYLFWTVNRRIALHARVMQENITQSDVVAHPAELKTRRVPLGLSYFAPGGFYLTGTATAVRQRIRQEQAGEWEADHFWNVDAAIGYRLPQRYGVARLAVKNLLDEEFSYQDANFGTLEPLAPDYLPERMILAQLRINTF